MLRWSPVAVTLASTGACLGSPVPAQWVTLCCVCLYCVCLYVCVLACCSTSRRLLLLDYDGTLIPHRNISAAPPAEVRPVRSQKSAARGEDSRCCRRCSTHISRAQ